MRNEDIINLNDFINTKLPWFHLPNELLQPMLHTSSTMVESTFIPQAFKQHLLKSHSEVLNELARRN